MTIKSYVYISMASNSNQSGRQHFNWMNWNKKRPLCCRCCCCCCCRCCCCTSQILLPNIWSIFERTNSWSFSTGHLKVGPNYGLKDRFKLGFELRLSDKKASTMPWAEGLTMHSDWLKIVMWLGTSYLSALFQCVLKSLSVFYPQLRSVQFQLGLLYLNWKCFN